MYPLLGPVLLEVVLPELCVHSPSSDPSWFQSPIPELKVSVYGYEAINVPVHGALAVVLKLTYVLYDELVSIQRVAT